MYKEYSLYKVLQNPYLVGVIVYIVLLYVALVKCFLLNPFMPEYDMVVYIMWVPTQYFFLILIWAMIRCIISDPGKVPVYWGILMDDSESKKRRYCLICHIFKPDRCHHCSTCKRCVLNMDHHCPWIGNCVGFQNRKFFMLFLFYINFSVLMSVIIVVLRLIPVFQQLIQKNWDIFSDYRVIVELLTQKIIKFCFDLLSSFLALIAFGSTISNFFKFHIDLVSENRTTIDTLELKRNNMSVQQHHNVFDMGYIIPVIQYPFSFSKNWQQVMGKNKILWFFPMFGESGRPVGDGVHWEKNSNQVTMSDANVTHRTQQTNQNIRSETNQTQNRRPQ